jgi:hypothetical protein
LGRKPKLTDHQKREAIKHRDKEETWTLLSTRRLLPLIGRERILACLGARDFVADCCGHDF